MPQAVWWGKGVGKGMDEVEVVSKLVDAMTDEEVVKAYYHWPFWARPSQLAPPGDWVIWLLMAGRGFGKSRSGVEWTIQKARDLPGSYGALISMDAGSARDVMLEGESGILACSPPDFMPNYEPSKRRITWPNGSSATIFTSVSPEDLRGPQFSWGWLDEMAAWQNVQATWDMFMFGLRLGKNPQCVVTTTPKPIPLVKKLLDEATRNPGGRVVVTRGTTYENRANLAPPFFKHVVAQYEGTALGRQELNAEIIDPEETGIIKRSWLKLWPSVAPLPKLHMVVQSYDTAYTANTENDPTACSVWGVFEEPKTPGVFSAIILDAWSEHMAYPDLRDRVKKEWGSVYGDKQVSADVVLIEEKGSGISLVQDLRLAGVPVKAYNPGRADKIQRLHAVSHLIYGGRVYIPESTKYGGKFATWSDALIAQLCAFPLVENDDYVDTATQALQLLRDQQWLSVDVIDDTVPEYDYHTRKEKRKNPYTA